MKNRVLTMVIIILIAITLILTAAVVVWFILDNKSNANSTISEISKPLNSKEIKENTVFVEGIITNLSAPKNSVISISLAFELENKKTKEDFENLLGSYIKGEIIKILNDKKEEEIQGTQGTDELVTALMNQLNPLFNNGKIKRIDVTNKVISK